MTTRDVTILGEPAKSGLPADPGQEGKGEIHLVHLYPREMSIYGDLGNTRCLEARLRWHGYEPNVISHNPGDDFPDDAHLVVVNKPVHHLGHGQVVLVDRKSVV